jgi:hypothetical protein
MFSTAEIVPSLLVLIIILLCTPFEKRKSEAITLGFIFAVLMLIDHC